VTSQPPPINNFNFKTYFQIVSLQSNSHPNLNYTMRASTIRLQPILRPKRFTTLTLLPRSSKPIPNPRQFTTTTSKMSFSNTDTGSKPADPYKAKNKDDDVTLQQKVEDLSDFISSCKFGMMTTRDAKSGALMSRCMALAGKVITPFPPRSFLNFRIIPLHAIQTEADFRPTRKTAASTSSSTPTPNPAKPMTSNPTHTSTSPSLTPLENGLPSPAPPTSALLSLPQSLDRGSR
jgi:hypothetical protein